MHADAKKGLAVLMLSLLVLVGSSLETAQADGAVTNRFTVPPGFVVETVIPPQPKTIGLDPKLPFSLINMTFDAKGRLLVAQERGPVVLCTNPDKDGILQTIKPYCKQVKNAQGLCWVRDALLVIGDGPQGAGLYRAKDTKGTDETDEVTLLHKFKGSMGEHGPHAIIHGPDDWLYVVVGNHAWAQPKTLADNSPLRRWPTGAFGPDQGKLDTTEDVLLPRLNDARGHAANILAPGGTIWRMDHEGKNISLVAAGFRNHFDAAFRSDGELFTFDSDMEWDENLPWYRPVRVCHVPPGADYVWRTGAANTPNYYLDSLVPLAETGRGSPVGVTVYEHTLFPASYQGTVFLADWSIGVIWAVSTKPNGASFKGEAVKFCTGSPLNVTDLEVGPDGSMYFTLGGRGSAGGVYRIRYTDKKDSFTQKVGALQPLAAWSKGRDTWKNPHDAIPTLTSCMNDLQSGNALKQRRACENLIRFNHTVTADAVWPLLQSDDQFVRTAARLVLQRIAPEQWLEKLSSASDLQAMEAIIALCKTNEANKHRDVILDRLGRLQSAANAEVQLQQLRTWQMVFIHTEVDGKAAPLQALIKKWFGLFPSADNRVNRELAILLTHAHRSGWTTLAVPEKLLVEMKKSATDRQQQIHYFYCARLLKDGWSPAMKKEFVGWYEQTKGWTGGHSFVPFLENIFKEWSKALTTEEKLSVLKNIEQSPFTASILMRDKDVQLTVDQMARMVEQLAASQDVAARKVQEAILENLGRDVANPSAQQALRGIADRHPEMLEGVVRSLVKSPSLENAGLLVKGLTSTSPIVLRDILSALRKVRYQPKPDDAETYRHVLMAVSRLGEKDRMQAIRLLQQWKTQRFSADGNDVAQELTGWTRWFGQQFPKAKPLPNAATLTASSKWKLDELRSYLEKDPQGRAGEVARGKLIFTKANCVKCHKFGSEGEGLGPDLTTLKSRFQRIDTLEAILDPSKTISDQYRGTVIVTVNGQTITGLAALQGDSVTVLQTDGSKVTLNKKDIESQIASTVSPMPEKLIDELTLQEIADLFAYLESTPKP